MERTSPPDPRAPRRAVVIGAGFAGIAAAATLARHGFAVEVLEKNDGPGGRAGVWREGGFTFDMGPSFYWMPEVFERFFAAFGTQAREHYELRRLDPSYRIVFGPGNELTLPASREAQRQLFESLEPGAAAASDRYLAEARVIDDLGMGDLVYRPSLSWLEYAHLGMLRGLLRTTVFRSLRSHVADHFTDHRLRSLMEFPALFLGATPQRTPALYSLMNHADLELGTWYPSGGMGRVVEAMVRVAESQGELLDPFAPVWAGLQAQGAGLADWLERPHAVRLAPETGGPETAAVASVPVPAHPQPDATPHAASAPHASAPAALDPLDREALIEQMREQQRELRAQWEDSRMPLWKMLVWAVLLGAVALLVLKLVATR